MIICFGLLQKYCLDISRKTDKGIMKQKNLVRYYHISSDLCELGNLYMKRNLIRRILISVIVKCVED